MITVIFLVLFGAIVVGFGLWAFAFGGMKRRGQSGKAEVRKQEAATSETRAGGLD